MKGEVVQFVECGRRQKISIAIWWTSCLWWQIGVLVIINLDLTTAVAGCTRTFVLDIT